MSVQIIGIKPNEPSGLAGIEAHLAMAHFIWVDISSQKKGETSRDAMYDWIVDKGGKAFLKRSDGEIIYIFGALSSGRKYIRAAADRNWTDDLIDLQKSADKPPDAA